MSIEATMETTTPSEPAPSPVLLHGDLDLTIHEARNLPNMDLLSSLLRRCLAPCLALCLPPPSSPHAHHDHPHHHHHHHPPLPTSDPYVTVTVASTTVARTHVIPNTEDPIWSAHFHLPLAHFIPSISFHVKDADPCGSDLIGTASLSAAELLMLDNINPRWLPIMRPDGGGPPKRDAAICISATFTPAKPEPHDKVPGYFPPRHGCKVRLYQDAHVRDGELPEIKLDGGLRFEPGRCWEEMCEAILEAHHLVYIVGWSVYTKVRLVRELQSPALAAAAAAAGVNVENMTLGELLKYKSEEGVRVCLLVWDDKTSHDTFLVRTEGVMQTHDERTKKYFKHSSVICVLSPRYPSSKLSTFKQKVVGTLYTHHQKCLLVDTPASENTRRITAFLGGLDLRDGRYDTPQHRLFDGLDTVFKDDFYNPTFGADNRGPRQPWHDLHCRLEGPAAYDVLENFEQRWKKATKLRELFGKESHWRNDSLLKLERISWMLCPSRTGPDDRSLWVLPEDDPECWHAQIFRSIDSGSVKGFPHCQEAPQKNLICDKGLVVEQSIHMAYIKAIRAAQRFIYIENQYFIGSSYAWPEYKHPGANNLVPMEIALKVASKIRAGERFAVYIIMPMWPEGIPSSAPVQEILYWQSQTMQMMYEVIAGELKSMKTENAHPRDYLNFYCLGKQELPGHRSQSYDESDGKGPAALARKHRRFMIYVHSKGMIVDDEYVIVGSANINQRSLAGSRDTEIAMGSYQLQHTWAVKKMHPHGQVYGYRMSLWAEHLGRVESLFEEPQEYECVKLVNQIADDNWARYTADVLVPLEGHLLRYPLDVDVDGRVGPLPDCKFFPDVGGYILGSSNNLPDTLTM